MESIRKAKWRIWNHNTTYAYGFVRCTEETWKLFKWIQFFVHEALRQGVTSKVRRDVNIKMPFLEIEGNQATSLEDQALITLKTVGMA